MRRIWFIALVALSFSGSALSARRAAADEPDHVQSGKSDAGFPSYSRQDQAKACLFSYGMENSSMLDCVARDQDYASALSKIWADIDDRFKRDCLLRLADEHLNSYFYLDRCIRSLEKDAAAPE